MKLNAFACRDGVVLSNECMLAPMQAETVHGAISRRLGIVDCGDLPPPVCEAVMESVYRDQYAFVPLAQWLACGPRIETA